jgi:beta-glucanase (GH16 family)
LQTLGIFTQEYGRFEARIKLPPGRGLWPAFWLEGTGNPAAGIGNGEIDIVEVNNRQQDVVTGYAHSPDHDYRAETVLNEPVSDSFHVFGVDWGPAGITWTIDGRAYGYFKSYAGWPFSHPFYLILDLAVGGGYPGAPTAQTKFPAQMLVDWIRVYRATE